jgi:predicted GNAT family acetyltransferase
MMAVHPDHRGQGLAGALNRHAVRRVVREGRCLHLCATVSPFNIANLRIMFHSGLKIRELAPRYGGKMRYLFHKHLARRPHDHRPASQDRRQVILGLAALSEQKEHFGEGYSGVALIPDPGLRVLGDASGITNWHLVLER